MGSLYHVIWENSMSFLSVALSYIYISTIFYNILLCQSDQGYGYIWQVKGHKISLSFYKYSR